MEFPVCGKVHIKNPLLLKGNVAGILRLRIEKLQTIWYRVAGSNKTVRFSGVIKQNKTTSFFFFRSTHFGNKIYHYKIFAMYNPDIVV